MPNPVNPYLAWLDMLASLTKAFDLGVAMSFAVYSDLIDPIPAKKK